MQLGVGLPSFASESHAIPRERFEQYASLTEEYGFAGAWSIEHLVEPPTYATSQIDPLTTLSYVTGTTKTIPVGTCVLLLPLRNPLMLARRVAAIQELSGRRVSLGMGTGYVEGEFDVAQVPIEERSSRYLEGIELLRRLFEEDSVTFDGEYYDVTDFRLEPKTRPPRLLAAATGHDTDDGRRMYRGVKERFTHADGWIAPPFAMDLLDADWGLVAEHLEARGRDPEGMEKVALQFFHLEPSDHPAQVERVQRSVFEDFLGPQRDIEWCMKNWLNGTVEEVRDHLAAYEQRGFDEVILYPVVGDESELDRQLRLYRDLLLPQYP